MDRMHRHITAIVLVASAALVAGCSVLPVSEEYRTSPASDIAPASGTNAVAATDPSTTRECRWSKGTGTKMRTRICYTQDVWARLDAAAEQGQETDSFFRGMREQSTLGSGGTPSPTSSPGL